MLDMDAISGWSGADAGGWKAELALEFAPSHGRTILSRRRHLGPLAVQRPFYPEGDDVCHVYALHPPGGVVGGDRLWIDLSARDGGRGLVTTPAAGKFYRSAGPTAHQVQTLRADAGSSLEWLPLETIVYPGARARLETRVELTGDAAFFGWDIICLGLPASNMPFEHGEFFQSTEVRRDGEPLLVEGGRYLGGSKLLHGPWGLGGHTVFGTLIATGGDAATDALIRDRAAAMTAKGRLGLTRMDGLTVCRALGDNAFAVRDLLAMAWAILRHATLGRAACAPRVWNT
jgi:urease accessory protein